MAPSPTGTAFCIAWPRSFSSRAASASLSAPRRRQRRIFAERMAGDEAAACRQTSSSPSRSSTRTTAMLTAISAGWAFSVSVSSLSGPSNISCESFWPQRLVDLLEHLRAPAAKASARARPMPTACEPCPGNVNARAIGSRSSRW